MNSKAGNLTKLTLILGIFSLCIVIPAQELQYEAITINIEIPVRVFKGNTFIDNLTIDDFEVYEDGKPQKIEAVYLIKKASVEKEEGEKKFNPEVSRNFVLMFEIQEYLPKIGEAIDYFFENVILPGDSCMIITPMKTYNLKRKSLEISSREIIANQLKGKLRKDARMGSSEYKYLIREIGNVWMDLAKGLVPEEEADRGPEYNLQLAASLYGRLESLRYVDQENFLGFAEFLKGKEGQKHVFIFYQKELMPQLDQKLTALFALEYSEELHLLHAFSDLSDFYRRDINFNVDLVKQAYADSSICVHFLFITKTPFYEIDITRVESASSRGIRMQEQSEDIFSAFREMAQASGGFMESSANASLAFKRAVDAAENYYLIYYAPKNYKEDGKFRNIRVKVKNKNYRITHRIGYVAD